MSIKNKLVTAVTTAGLLAGLFGSAFVPAASGAGRIDPTLTPVAGRTTFAHGSRFGGVDTLGATTPSVAASPNAAKNQVDKASSRSLYWSQVAAYGDFDAVSTAATSANAYIDITLKDSTGAEIESQMDLKATVNNTLIGVAWAYDSGSATQIACDANDADPVAPAYDIPTTTYDTLDEVEAVEDGATGVYRLCVLSEGATKVGTSVITIVANGVTLPTVTVTTLGDLASVELSAAAGFNAVSYSNNAVAKFWKVIGKDKAGNVLNSGDTSWGGTLAAFNITEDSAAPDHASGLDSSWTYIDETVGAVDLDLAGFGLRAMNRYTLSADVCNTASYTGAGDGDEGKTFALAIEGVSAGADVITSNAVSIKCTRDENYAKVGSISATATSGPVDYVDADEDTAWYVYAYMVDVTDGTPIGVGADFIDGTYDLGITNPTALTGATWTENADAASFSGTNGRVLLGSMDPGGTFAAVKHEYVVKVASTNFYNEEVLGETAVPLAQKLYFDASVDFEAIATTFKRTANKRSATVTVNCGYADSLSQVVFVIAKGNGDVVDRTRRANINGVVKITLSARNTTWDVYAECTDDDSEVAIIRFR